MRKVLFLVIPTVFLLASACEVASFIPGYSSVSCREFISVEPYSHDNKYRIKLGYPESVDFPGVDPRNDPKIIARLKKRMINWLISKLVIPLCPAPL